MADYFSVTCVSSSFDFVSYVDKNSVDISRCVSIMCCAQVLDKFGHLDVLVNNAGIMPALRFLRQTPEQIQRTFDVNVMGNIWVSPRS